MEKFLKALDELEKIDPEDWHNIPAPLVQGISSIKNCIRIQSSILENLSSQFQNLETKNNKKFISFKQCITENEEKIKEGHKKSKHSIESLEVRLRESLSDFKQNISETMHTESANSEYKFKEMVDNFKQLQQCVRVVPTLSQIQETINESANLLQEKIKKDVQDSLITPEIYNVYQKIYLVEE